MTEDYMAKVNRNTILNTRDKLRGEMGHYQRQLKVVEDKILEGVREAVVEYLANNTISGDSYKVTRLEYSGGDAILIHLVYSDDEFIDESFEDDPKWDEFTSKLATMYQLRLVTVPYWYYPK